MRLDRPAGFYAFYLPYATGILYAACIASETPTVATTLGLLAMLVPFNILLRGAVCAWNDNIDQEFDRRVERTRHRPVARGAVSTAETHVFTVGLLIALCPFLIGLPAACWYHMAFTNVLFFVYAFMKRITFYPSVFLGFPFAWAVFFCIAALGMDPFEDTYGAPTMAMFAAHVFWAITCDTIYSHQDITDDERAGVKSMALRFPSSTKVISSVVSILQVASLGLCGSWADFGYMYYSGSVAGVALGLAWWLVSVDLKSPRSCGSWFQYQFWIVGAAFTAGLAGEYATVVSRN